MEKLMNELTQKSAKDVAMLCLLAPLALFAMAILTLFKSVFAAYDLVVLNRFEPHRKTHEKWIGVGLVIALFPLIFIGIMLAFLIKGMAMAFDETVLYVPAEGQGDDR